MRAKLIKKNLEIRFLNVKEPVKCVLLYYKNKLKSEENDKINFIIKKLYFKYKSRVLKYIYRLIDS